MRVFLFTGLILIGLLGCQQKNGENQSSQSSDVNTPQNDVASEQIRLDQEYERVVKRVQLTLSDLFKEDIEGGILDSLSRTYIFKQIDLNNDEVNEILVGLIGPYFCGSGGCTVLLLSDQGELITRFSVVKFPALLDIDSTNGWKNMIFYSGGENRLVTFNGQSYASNPSILPVYSGKIEDKVILLDWDEGERLHF